MYILQTLVAHDRQLLDPVCKGWIHFYRMKMHLQSSYQPQAHPYSKKLANNA